MKYLVKLTLDRDLRDGETIELTDFGAVVSDDEVDSGRVGSDGGWLGTWELTS